MNSNESIHPAESTHPISVLICTRNRPQDLVDTLPSVLAQDYPNYEVVVIDQSTTDETENSVRAKWGSDPRLRYIRTNTSGLSISRNLALDSAKHDICAFTDDDCTVPPHWLSRLAEAYQANPETDVLFSPVHIPKELWQSHNKDMFFPCFYFKDRRALRRWEVYGMGANMSMRKSAWQKVGPFDAMLGAGSPMPGAEEHDWLYRAHRLSAVIRLEPDNPIDHRCFRTREQWMNQARIYAVGDAAFAMKHLRCGDLRVVSTILRSVFYLGARGLLRVLQRNSGWTYEYNYVRGYLSGLWKSLRMPVNRSARLFA